MVKFSVDSKSIEDDVIQIQSRSMPDPTLSDIDFKNMVDLVWTTLKIKHSFVLSRSSFGLLL